MSEPAEYAAENHMRNAVQEIQEIDAKIYELQGRRRDLYEVVQKTAGQLEKQIVEARALALPLESGGK